MQDIIIIIIITKPHLGYGEAVQQVVYLFKGKQ